MYFFRTSLCIVVVMKLLSIANAEIHQRDLFISGNDGYHTYRIPSILVTSKGTVLVFCEGRKNHRRDWGDIDLLVKRSEDHGMTFSSQSIIWDDANNTCGNPCVVQDQQTGIIFLFSTWNLGSDKESTICDGNSKDTRRVFVLQSEDDGLSWSNPKEVTENVKASHWRWFATGPGHGIQLMQGAKRGRLIIPCDHSYPECIPGQYLGSHVIYSDDHGKTWKYSDAIIPNVNENEIVELLDGRLMMNARNHRYIGSRVVAISEDGGETWPYVSYNSNLPEPKCQASIIRYSPNNSSDRDIILFSNPSNSKERLNMSIKASYDSGKTWPVVKSLHEQFSAYSCLAVLPNGKIVCLYEAGIEQLYEKIVIAIFTLDWLENN